MARVELRNIRKSFGATEVIRGVDLSIDKGEFVVFRMREVHRPETDFRT